MGRLSKDGLFEIIQYDLSMLLRRSVNYYRCPISKYVQFINNVVCCLVTDVTRSSCTVIFKRMGTIKGQNVDVYPFLNKYVLIYKIY